MPDYKYMARDMQGNAASGVIFADDELELRQILRSSELFLTRAEGGKSRLVSSKSPESTFSFLQRPTLQDMVIATRQLGAVIRAGLPMIDALEIVGGQTNKPKLKDAFQDLQQGVSQGQALSVSMRKHPEIFNQLILSLVEAGEASGTLDQAFEIIAGQLDREAVLKQKIKLATAYPKLVVLTAVGTIAGMLMFVVPVFSDVYAQFKGQLPAPTLMLIALSHFMAAYWWLLILVAALGYLSIREIKKTPKGLRWFDSMSLKMPGIGPIMRKLIIARFVLTLSGAMRAGVPVLSSLLISANTSGNVVIRDAVVGAAQNVRDGAGISQELVKTGEFPIMVTRMIAAGEASGNVDDMLDEVNRFYERDVSYAVDTLTRLMEPAMTVVMGTIVLLILLALYMPVFNLAKIIKDR